MHDAMMVSILGTIQHILIIIINLHRIYFDQF